MMRPLAAPEPSCTGLANSCTCAWCELASPTLHSAAVAATMHDAIETASDEVARRAAGDALLDVVYTVHHRAQGRLPYRVPSDVRDAARRVGSVGSVEVCR